MSFPPGCACAECAPRVPRREHDERDVIAPSAPDDMSGASLFSLNVNDDELARWTGVGTGSVHDARAAESAVAAGGLHLARGTEPDITAAQLHAALTVVADLLGVLDLKAHMFQPSQDAIWRARELLREHGVAEPVRGKAVTP